MFSLGAPPSPNLHVFTNSEALQTYSFEFLWKYHKQAQLTKSLAIGD